MSNEMDKGEDLTEKSMEKIYKSIKCKRCKRNLKNMQRKTLNVGTNKYNRICDHCLAHYLLHKTRKSGIHRKTSYKGSTRKKYIKDKVKLWLSKIIELLDNNMIFLDPTDSSTKSSTKTLCSYKISLTTEHTPKIELMFKTTKDLVALEEEQPEKIVKRDEDAPKKRIITEFGLVVPSENDFTLSESSRSKQQFICKQKFNIFKNEKGQGLAHLRIQKLCTDKIHHKNIFLFSNLSDDISSTNFNNICDKSTSSDIKISKSFEHINSSFSILKDTTIETNFSYVFPKERLKKAINRQKSSSEIIKEIIENSRTFELEKTKIERDPISKLTEEKRNDQLQKQIHKSDLEKKLTPHLLHTKRIESSKKITDKAKEKKGKSYDKSKNTYKEKNEKEIQKKLDRPHSQTNEASKEKGKKEQTQITDKEVESQSETPAKGDVGSETPDYTKDADQNQENKRKGVGLAIIKAKEKEMRSRMKNKQKEKSKNDGQVQPTTTELTISKVKLRKPSTDDLVLQLVKIKHSEDEHRVRPKRWSELNISPLIIKRHQGHKLHQCMPGTRCLFCEDSELELDIDNILYNEEKQEELGDVIKGTKILKNVIPKKKKYKDKDAHEPFLFNTKYEPIHQDMKEEFKSSQPPKKQPETEVTKGVTRYALSDRSFIDKGWTLLPTEKIVRQMNVYRMRPANPEFNWFVNNKNKKMSYDTGEKLAEIDDNGKGHWFYRNGCKALDYYDAEEIHVQQRYVIYSNGEPDDRGRSRPLTILAMFDYLGNGIVFDHKGKIRLKYNQTEGVVLDRNIGPVSHWKWHTLNDPPVLQQILIDTHLTHKDPDILKFSGPGDDITRHENEDMIAIEFDNFIKEKSKKLSQNFEPFQIKMKALKINENFSLRVLGQDKIYLIFRDGSTKLKLNIGMVLDHKEIVDTDIAEVGEVSNSLKRYPAPSSSIAALQENIEQTKCIQRARLERERRIRPKQIYSSADKLISGISKPLRKPILPAPSRATTNSTEYQCRCRKPSLKNLYYDTRLI